MTYFEAYILTRLDPLKSLFSSLSELLFFVFLFMVFVCVMGSAISYSGDFGEDFSQSVKKFKKKFWFFILPVFCISCLIKNLIPTSKEMAFIYIAPAIVNNKDVQKTIQKIPELSGLGLEYINELLKTKIEEIKK